MSARPFSPAGLSLPQQPQNQAVANWLFLCTVVVFLMVLLGGVTRLTHSGLSMVDWRPIMGVIPPITEAQWQETFDAYKQYPEYQKVNRGMDLDGFKGIFWLEYLHRLLGRGIGLLFALPFVYFLWRGAVQGVVRWKLAGMFVLGGLQGLMGWYMVKSGLIDDPKVSPARLTAHLGLAIAIFVGLFWMALDHRYGASVRPRDRGVYIAAALVVVTMLSGGFVAGTRAGLLFGTWPLMGETFFPAGLFAQGLSSVFIDPVTIQFDHRMLAYLTTIVVVSVALNRLRQGGSPVAWLVLGLVVLQVVLGILTIIYRVPITLAATHQGVALLLLAALVFLAHRSALRPQS